MTVQQQNPVELPIGSICNGHLTSAAYSSVFESMLTALPQIRSGGEVHANLEKIEWIDHLPLLAVSLLVKQCARLRPGCCEVIMPAILEREAFLERWGFFRLLDDLKIGYEFTDNPNPHKESQHSRVLPITSFRTCRALPSPVMRC